MDRFIVASIINRYRFGSRRSLKRETDRQIRKKGKEGRGRKLGAKNFAKNVTPRDEGRNIFLSRVSYPWRETYPTILCVCVRAESWETPRCNNNELATCEASRKGNSSGVLCFYTRRNLVFLDSGSTMEINKVTRHDYFTFENYGRTVDSGLSEYLREN